MRSKVKKTSQLRQLDITNLSDEQVAQIKKMGEENNLKFGGKKMSLIEKGN